jgi:hypothetical protein
MYLEKSNFISELHNNLQQNDFFNSKIKDLSINNRYIYIYKNIKSIYYDIFYRYNCAYTDSIIEYKIHIYYNKINSDFIIYFTKIRYYVNSKYINSKYVSRYNDYYSHPEKKYYNVTLSDLDNIITTFINYLQEKPYYNRDDLYDIKPIICKCKKRIQLTINNYKKLLDKFLLNDDCNDIIILYLV